MSNRRIIITAITLIFATSQASAQPKGFNYDESRVPEFELPDPLVANNGYPVTSASQWQNSRRAEILEQFEDSVYGRRAQLPSNLSFTTTSVDRKALDGTATRKQVTVRFEDQAHQHALDLC